MLGRADLQRMGFAFDGLGVQVSDKASFYGASRISLKTTCESMTSVSCLPKIAGSALLTTFMYPSTTS